MSVEVHSEHHMHSGGCIHEMEVGLDYGVACVAPGVGNTQVAKISADVEVAVPSAEAEWLVLWIGPQILKIAVHVGTAVDIAYLKEADVEQNILTAGEPNSQEAHDVRQSCCAWSHVENV